MLEHPEGPELTQNEEERQSRAFCHWHHCFIIWSFLDEHKGKGDLQHRRGGYMVILHDLDG